MRWRRLTRITNEELERLRLNFLRCTTHSVETDEMREINDRVRKQSRTRQIGKSYGSINANQ